MDILVFSDSHGKGEYIDAILRRQVRLPDVIFFLGDGLRDLAWQNFGGIPVYRVKGNCDFFGADTTDDELLTELGGVRIFAAHGHTYSVKSGYMKMAQRAAELGADIMLFGHTHEPLTRVLSAGESLGGTTLSRDLHIMNPGSLASGCFGTVTVRGSSILLCTAEQ